MFDTNLTKLYIRFFNYKYLSIDYITHEYFTDNAYMYIRKYYIKQNIRIDKV